VRLFPLRPEIKAETPSFFADISQQTMILYIALIVILSCIALVYVKWQQQKNKFKHIPGHSQLILPPLALRLVHVFPFLKQYIGVTDESILIGSLNKEFGPVAKMQSFGFNVMNIRYKQCFKLIF
jgi:glucan phosphoethanolaminetransferase (alkaline phosphatase superfamily)